MFYLGDWPLTLMFVSYISDNSPLFTCGIALKKKKGITLYIVGARLKS